MTISKLKNLNFVEQFVGNAYTASCLMRRQTAAQFAILILDVSQRRNLGWSLFFYSCGCSQKRATIFFSFANFYFINAAFLLKRATFCAFLS